MKKITIGSLETVSFPLLDIEAIARVDTGATTSSLHVDEYEITDTVAGKQVRFTYQLNGENTIYHSLPLLQVKKVISSNGTAEYRPVVETDMTLGEKTWHVKLTLTNRERMRYPMLLGRQAMGKKFLIDPSVKFLLSS